jgi:hypothetical protein
MRWVASTGTDETNGSVDGGQIEMSAFDQSMFIDREFRGKQTLLIQPVRSARIGSTSEALRSGRYPASNAAAASLSRSSRNTHFFA